MFKACKEYLLVAIVMCIGTSCVADLSQAQNDCEGVVLEFSSYSEQDDSLTRTHWTGETILWSEGDRILMTYTDNGQWAAKGYVSEALKADAECALFTVNTDLPVSHRGSLRYYAIYPSSSVSGGFTSGPSVTVDIPSTQTPSATSFDRTADLMLAYSTQAYDSPSSEPIPLLWRRQTAHVDVTLILPEFQPDEIIKAISFKVDEGACMCGTYEFDMHARKFTPVSSDIPTNVVTINPENVREENGRMNLWLSVLPVQIQSLDVSIETEKSSYVRQIGGCSLEFVRNKRNVLSIDMSQSRRVLKPDVQKNALINDRLFDVIDLGRPGLENVKYYYDAGCLYEAAQELKVYYETRTDVSVPLVDLSYSRYSASQKWIADQALKENGYRFYISNNYIESTSDQGDVYYSFLDDDGSVNWDYRPTTEDSFPQFLHRHPWIANQALVYWATKDEKYVKSIVEVYSDWLKDNPCPVAGQESYYMGMGHKDYRKWCQLQASARIETYIKVIEYCKAAESLTPEFLSDLLVSLYDCVECIRANYYYSDASNIRQSEVQAVLNMAVMMPEYKKSAEWLDEASSEVNRLLGAMLAEDGVLVEKDPSYHISVISTFYDSHRALSSNGQTSILPSDYFTRLKGGVYFVRDLMYPDYSIEDFNDTRSSSWTKSVLTKNFVKYSEMFPEDQTLQWFATDRKSGAAPAELMSLYSTSGYYMLRTGWQLSDMMLVLKNNENVKGYTHCQNDNCTISLYRNGRNFLPDSGVYTYGGSDADDALREQYRQTKMHNTMTLNGANSVNNKVDQCGVFKKSSQTDVYDMVHVSNQSYGALRHERHVYRIKDGFFVIVDQGFGSATGTVELNWHMCPGTMNYVRRSDSYEARTTFADGNNMLFKTFCFDGTTLNSDFDVQTSTSWHSDLPGRKFERPCYAISEPKTTNPVRFITVIYPFAKEGSLPQMSARVVSASRVIVTVADKEYSLAL